MAPFHRMDTDQKIDTLDRLGREASEVISRAVLDYWRTHRQEIIDMAPSSEVIKARLDADR